MAKMSRLAGAMHGATGTQTGGGASMNNWSAQAWRAVVESAPEGIVVCDATAPDRPVVYANAAFAQLCGYPAAALLGSNLRMLQGTDRDQETRQRLRDAVQQGQACRVLIRN